MLVKTNRATQTTYCPPSSVGRHIAIQEGCCAGTPRDHLVYTSWPRGIVVQQVRAVRLNNISHIALLISTDKHISVQKYSLTMQYFASFRH